jgi:hypothetical protein
VSEPESPRRAGRVLRWAFLLVAAGAVLLALHDQGAAWRRALADIGPGALVLSQLAALAGLLASAACWRAVLAALGHALDIRPALHIFFVGQVAKYLPGNVFALAAQAELARDHRVPRSRVVLAGLVFLGVLTTSGLLVAAATLPFSASGALRTYAWVLPALPVGLLLLFPPVLQRVLGLLLRLLRRPPLDGPLGNRALLRATGWAFVMWGWYGLHLVPLERALGSMSLGRALVLGLGGYALAWTAGFLFVVAPAGAVVREAILVLVLAGVLHRPEAAAVAIASRGVQTAGDVIWALVGAALGRRRRLTTRRRTGGPPSS